MKSSPHSTNDLQLSPTRAALQHGTADEQLRQCVIKTGEDRLDVPSADYTLSRDELSGIYGTIVAADAATVAWAGGFGRPQSEGLRDRGRRGPVLAIEVLRAQWRRALL